MQSWHFSVVGLNADILFSRIFHETFGLFPASFSFQKYADKVVELFGELISRLFFVF